jgi:hypothetical protein
MIDKEKLLAIIKDMECHCEYGIGKDCDRWEAVDAIEVLYKENAELKKKLEVETKVYDDQYYSVAPGDSEGGFVDGNGEVGC